MKYVVVETWAGNEMDALVGCFDELQIAKDELSEMSDFYKFAEESNLSSEIKAVAFMNSGYQYWVMEVSHNLITGAKSQ